MVRLPSQVRRFGTVARGALIEHFLGNVREFIFYDSLFSSFNAVAWSLVRDRGVVGRPLVGSLIYDLLVVNLVTLH
jgi:hypothetical protein